MSSFRNLFLLLFWFALLYLLCNAQEDSINQSQYVSDGQTLVSTSETFVLGFFSPSATTQNRYLGIWFNPKKFSSQTIVWVANRENPITDSSGVFKITRDGNPVILDSNGSLIWSANPSIAIRNGSIAKLLDSGNLILIDGNSHIITWQSFDEPCDTLLQGMKMGMVGISSKKQFLTSWESPENPASGSFSFGIDTHGLNQLVLWEGNKKRWRSGGTFIGIPGMSNFISNGFMLVSDNRGDDYVTLSQSLGPSSVITKFVIDSFGFLKQTDWIEGSNDWNVSFSKPIAQCEVYGQCGPNGVCNQNGSPICSCLDGFVPKSPLDWTVGRWSDGCLRRTKLDCEKNSSSGSKGGDGFKRLISMKLPDHSNWVAVGHFKGCRDTCVKNCSCIGYAFVDGIGCMVSFGELIDLQRFPNGGLDFYLRLAASEIGEESIILVLPLVIALSMPLLAGLGEAIRRETQTRRNSKSKDKEKSSEFLLLNLRTSIDGREKQGEMTIFDLSEIVGATNNFSIENKLGQGGFGPVYKGMFQDGQQIAVKRLSKSSSQGLEEFKNEVMLISKLQHRNLVKLFGCCVEVEEKLLIYEYMPNKSLDAMLFDPMRGALLDWRKRFDIIEGIARGLLYLHRDSRLRIIHRDLKASNILLDDQMNPKISDFGMARIFGGNETQENTQRVVGTYGYMSPEYAMEGRFSEKSDVFSFGVLLLEIISGKRNTRFYHLELCLNLVGYAWLLWNEGKGMELVDPLLADSFNTDEILKCIHLALLCVQDGPTDRPTMSSIMIMLGSDAATLPSPKQPTFTVERCHVGSNLSNKNAKIHSIADLTITVVEGR